MYDENSFKNYIFWIKVKRFFFMFVFSAIGATIGFFISEYVIDILLFDPGVRTIITIGATLLFFAISLLITANTGKEVQDGYWKIAVLRKLTVISKKLDSLENLESLENLLKQNIQLAEYQNVPIENTSTVTAVPEKTETVYEESNINNNDDIELEDNYYETTNEDV